MLTVEVTTLEDTLSAPADFVDAVLLQDCIDRLPEPLPRLLRLRMKGLTQSETARLLGLTQVRVSRLERRARELLAT